MEQTVEPKQFFLMLLSLLLGALGTICRDIRVFIQSHSFAMHVLMSAGQWLCYMSSFGVGLITIYKFLKAKRDGYK
jgi:hypothetical protein